jgi:anti-anti-sigma factor
MTERFFVRDRRAADCTVLTIGGELDVATAPALRSHLSDLIADGRTRLVLDLAPLDFLDASGLGVLASTLGRLRERGGWLRLVNVHPRIRRLLGIVRLTDVLPEYASVALAAGAGQPGPSTSATRETATAPLPETAMPETALLARLGIAAPASPTSAEPVATATATGAVARPLAHSTRTPAKGPAGDE